MELKNGNRKNNFPKIPLKIEIIYYIIFNLLIENLRKFIFKLFN